MDVGLIAIAILAGLTLLLGGHCVAGVLLLAAAVAIVATFLLRRGLP